MGMKKFEKSHSRQLTFAYTLKMIMPMQRATNIDLEFFAMRKTLNSMQVEVLLRKTLTLFIIAGHRHPG